jgi:hypothetical protein
MSEENGIKFAPDSRFCSQIGKAPHCFAAGIYRSVDIQNEITIQIDTET